MKIQLSSVHGERSGQGLRVLYGALVEAGIPATAFAVDDIESEYERLKGRGVRFTMEPTQAGPVTIAVFDDTCGNLIQIYQV